MVWEVVFWGEGDWREGMGGVGREGEGLVDEIGGEIEE